MNVNGVLGAALSPLTVAPKAGKPAGPPEVDPAVMAQISDAARSLWQQMRRDGVTDQSFDLHLDLRQVGMSVDASGRRSVEGHSLTIDLHVEAHQGKFKTDNGEASFGSLDLQLEMEQVDFWASEGAGEPKGARPADQKNGGLVDGLKKLIDLLDKTDDAESTDDFARLLDQIGRALVDMGKRLQQRPVQDAQKQAA